MIDFHTHIFPEKIVQKTIPMLAERNHGPAYTDGTASGLEASMDEAGITTSVVLPVVTRVSQFESINRFAVELNERYASGRLISFGGIHPDCEDYKGCLKKIKALGLKGIKLHPDYQNTFFNDAKYMRIVEYASELDLIVIVHAGVDVGLPEPVHCTPTMAREVLCKVQPSKLVLAHMGGIHMWKEVEELLVGEHVYLDTAYVLPLVPPEQLQRMVRQHGIEKVLFASDSPWQNQRRCVELLRQMNWTQEEMQALLRTNAETLLGI